MKKKVGLKFGAVHDRVCKGVGLRDMDKMGEVGVKYSTVNVLNSLKIENWFLTAENWTLPIKEVYLHCERIWPHVTNLKIFVLLLKIKIKIKCIYLFKKILTGMSLGDTPLEKIIYFSELCICMLCIHTNKYVGAGGQSAGHSIYTNGSTEAC